jgi:hypothetical protein
MNHWLSLTPRSDLVARLVLEFEGELYQPRIWTETIPRDLQ